MATTYHARGHAQKRRYIVENTEEFGENILQDNVGCDYAIFKNLEFVRELTFN